MDKSEIVVMIPAQSRFVALSRVMAASLAHELDFTIDEIEDIRSGADELMSLMIEWAEDHGIGEVEVRYRLTRDTLEVIAGAGSVDGDSRPAAESPPLDDITRMILDAVVDDFEIGAGRGWIVKRRDVS